MRWALLFLVLAGVTCTAYVIRGVWERDGLALLVVVFLVLAAASGWATHAMSRRSDR